MRSLTVNAALKKFFIRLYWDHCNECNDGVSVFWSERHKTFHHNKYGTKQQPSGGPCNATTVRVAVRDFFGRAPAFLSESEPELSEEFDAEPQPKFEIGQKVYPYDEKVSYKITERHFDESDGWEYFLEGYNERRGKTLTMEFEAELHLKPLQPKKKPDDDDLGFHVSSARSLKGIEKLEKHMRKTKKL